MRLPGFRGRGEKGVQITGVWNGVGVPHGETRVSGSKQEGFGMVFGSDQHLGLSGVG